ncbi:hypothetical protein, partial [Burkholderia territorii]|uniref:hypothetical protein n=1 Tax=Burkholderia territorii TaxID=1503055 RepID=UPI001E2F68D0
MASPASPESMLTATGYWPGGMKQRAVLADVRLRRSALDAKAVTRRQLRGDNYLVRFVDNYDGRWRDDEGGVA